MNATTEQLWKAKECNFNVPKSLKLLSHGHFSTTFSAQFASWDTIFCPFHKSNLITGLYFIPEHSWYILIARNTICIFHNHNSSYFDVADTNPPACWIHRITWGRNTSCAFFYNFGFFSNWHGGSFVSFPLAMRSRLPPALPFAFCLEDTAEIQKLGSQHVFPLSLTPIFFNSLKRLLTPDREAEERAGLRPGPCGILSTVDCPPRPNPRPPRSSRPHPPPSWSGAHTDTRSLIDCNQCGNTYSSKSSEDT